MKRAACLAALALAACGAEPAPRAPVSTAPVERGALAAQVTVNGTLTYRGRRDAVNQARGIYTRLPAAGDRVRCGEVLYRIDDRPVLLLCGSVPAYRDLRARSHGRDARQLTRNLRRLGYGSIKALQRAKGLRPTGTLKLGDAVFLPGPIRIAKVTGRLGGYARPGARVLRVTSDTLEVRAKLGDDVHAGDKARVMLPDGRTLAATVAGNGTLRLRRPPRALERAPVRVEIETTGVEAALSVPVTALVGKPGGGVAVEVVRGRGRELVGVKLGLVDTSRGRVAIEGALRAGDRVVVP